MSDIKNRVKPDHENGLAPGAEAPDAEHHEDERSPLAPEDDHSGADFDIADEIDAKLGAAEAPALSPPAPLSVYASDDDDLHAHDDEYSPFEYEDDHSGADFDIADEIDAKLGANEAPALSAPATPASASAASGDSDSPGTPGDAGDADDEFGLYDDERSPLDHEDDHSGADVDIAVEVESKLGMAEAPRLSAPPPPPAGAAEDAADEDYGLHDDDRSPLEHEDDHSGADAGHEDAYMHPGLAAALSASYAYAQKGIADDDAGADEPDENGGAACGDDEDDGPIDPEDSGEDDDGIPGDLDGPASPADSPGDSPDDAAGADSSADDASQTAPRTMDAAIAAAAAEASATDDDDDDEDDDEDEDDEDEEEEDEEDAEDKPMTLRDHLTELRKRLFRAFMWMILGFMVCYPFAEQLFDLLFKPLMKAMPEASKLIYTSPPEAFFTFMKVAFVAGIFSTSPLIFYQVWAFVAPGLYKEEKLYILPVAVFSALFFISGGAFCYFVVFPFAFEFFMSYNQGLIQAMPSLNETLSFVLQLLLAFGLVFELPLFVFFLSRLGIVTADMMRRFRRYAVLVMVIVAAILTPPDVLSQLLMAGPLMLLYEASILIAAAFGKKKEKPQDEKDEDEEEEDDDDDADAPAATQKEQA